MALIDSGIHRVDVDEYLQIVEDARRRGDGRWERTELIDGVVHDMSPESSLHGDAVIDLFDQLRELYPRHLVKNVGSIVIDRRSLWDPDVYVLARRDPAQQYPVSADVALVVEVALTTATRDLGEKLAGYARNRIPECIVVVPTTLGKLYRYTDPTGEEYTTSEVLTLPRGYADVDLSVWHSKGTSS